MRGRVAVACLLAALLGCGGDTPMAPRSNLVITISPGEGVLATGADYLLSATVTDTSGAIVPGSTVTFTTDDEHVATVTAAGRVHPVMSGFVAIYARSGDAEGVATFNVTDARVVSGVVLTADGAPTTNLSFIARFGSGKSFERFATPVDGSTGAFSLTIPRVNASGPTAEFFVDAAPGTTRRYHVSYVSMAPGLLPSSPTILMIPHSIVIDSGTYAGTSVPVDLNEAFTPVCTTADDANCQGYWPQYWVSGIKMWPDLARPVPLAIDRTTSPVSASDSIAIWATIHNMEADVGRRLYRPANFSAYTTTGYTAGMVLASIDANVAPFTGYTNWFWDGANNLYQARTRMRTSTFFDNNSSVSHELNHAMGFSHTCRWATIMGGYGCGQTDRLSVSDVAYWQLAQLVRRQASSVGATWSVAEGLAGDRVVELGVAASEAIPVRLRPFASRLRAPGSDGAP